jgi:hypothetical protein
MRREAAKSSKEDPVAAPISPATEHVPELGRPGFFLGEVALQEGIFPTAVG